MAEWRDTEGGAIEFWIEADSFMRHMVRILVGTMLGVAAGRMELDGIRPAADGRPAQRGRRHRRRTWAVPGVTFGTEPSRSGPRATTILVSR